MTQAILQFATNLSLLHYPCQNKDEKKFDSPKHLLSWLLEQSGNWGKVAHVDDVKKTITITIQKHEISEENLKQVDQFDKNEANGSKLPDVLGYVLDELHQEYDIKASKVTILVNNEEILEAEPRYQITTHWGTGLIHPSVLELVKVMGVKISSAQIWSDNKWFNSPIRFGIGQSHGCQNFFSKNME